jgi:hypothetical protein
MEQFMAWPPCYPNRGVQTNKRAYIVWMCVRENENISIKEDKEEVCRWMKSWLNLARIVQPICNCE